MLRREMIHKRSCRRRIRIEFQHAAQIVSCDLVTIGKAEGEREIDPDATAPGRILKHPLPQRGCTLELTFAGFDDSQIISGFLGIIVAAQGLFVILARSTEVASLLRYVAQRGCDRSVIWIHSIRLLKEGLCFPS